jgi:hypothetical protein
MLEGSGRGRGNSSDGAVSMKMLAFNETTGEFERYDFVCARLSLSPPRPRRSGVTARRAFCVVDDHGTNTLGWSLDDGANEPPSSRAGIKVPRGASVAVCRYKSPESEPFLAASLRFLWDLLRPLKRSAGFLSLSLVVRECPEPAAVSY